MIDTKQDVVWKTYPDYPFIQANQFGEVRMVDRVAVRKNGIKFPVKGRMLKQYLDGHGYLNVFFGVNGKQITLKVHRIVAACFLPNPNNLPEVNHKDNNPKNNSVSNLEWCSHEYNIAYREKYGKSAAEVLGCPVFAVNLKTLDVSHFETQTEAARQLGLSQTEVSATVKGRRNQAGGYWFTEDKNEIDKEKIKEIKDSMYFLGGVIAVNLETFEVSRFKSQREAAKQLEVNFKSINDVLKGRKKKTHGYWFCYADESAVENTRARFDDRIASKVKMLMNENYN